LGSRYSCSHSPSMRADLNGRLMNENRGGGVNVNPRESGSSGV